MKEYKGLNEKQVEDRIKEHGLNELLSKKSKTKFEIIIDIIKDPIILIMIAAFVLSIITNLEDGHFGEAYVILGLIVLNCVISFIQELKTLSELESLAAMNEDTVTVIRDGNEQEVKAKQLVVDDIVKLKIGDIVRADLEILTSNDLQVDEAFLTGESDFVAKDNGEVVFSNSSVQNGTAIGIVKSTGMNTEIGKIAKRVTDVEDVKSQLEIKILDITKLLMKIAILMAVLIFVLTLLSGKTVEEAISFATSILIATVPEGLATVLTIVLTFMSSKIARHNALVKKINLLETLGEVSYVCSDKTGTITENKMKVVEKQFFTSLNNSEQLLHLIIDDQSPTTRAIYEHINQITARNQIDFESGFEVIDFQPFNSQKKYSAHILQIENIKFLVCVGAPDILVNHMTLEPYYTEYGNQGLRPILVSYKQITDNCFEFSPEQMTPLCLFGIQDPPKDSAVKTINEFEQAGIVPVMITGDNKVTATSIARQAGIIRSDRDLVLTHDQLNSLSDEELDQMILDVKVYARAKPEDKVRIVKSLQARNQIVAMMGDGTNDSIALRQANIGIAMGINGTDISKEAADLILLDDNYSTIDVGIQAGRLIFINIQKFVRQMLTSNTAHSSTIMFALLLDIFSQKNLLLPLTPVLILWINIVSDAIPCLALGLDDAESDLMSNPPIDPDAKILPTKMISEILLRGMTIGLLVLIGFTYTINQTDNVELARSIGFVILSFGQLIHIFDVRSSKTIYSRNPFGNKWIILTVGLSALLNLSLIYTPLNTIFGLAPIALNQLVIAILISSIPTFVYSLIKKLRNKF
ncbi:cation-transporting P-type ATPase [Mollicutes bacterium LVI A0078]|nr:cation-transporting P-type ATPase [Mollicutes bacterium LVI A0075]WOO91796.1 cation-transporting P-type ATPase [Mollicutes bacterium LVI A0078]